MEKTCKQCGNTFEVNENVKRQRNKKFCNRICSSKFIGSNNKGRKHTEEVNKKKGLKGDLNPFYSKKHSKETKKKMSESSLWDESKFKYCNLNEKEMKVFDGLMLSDGCLTDTSRISARLSFGFKYKSVCEAIQDELKSLTFTPTSKSEITNCYHFKSHMFRDLLDENKRWYKKGVKIVPRDIKLDRTICYWWFIGDGYTSGGNVYLCTDSFKKDDNIFLISLLNDLGFNSSLTANNRIRFRKNDSINFLNWIEDNKIKEYYYKWEI